MTGTELSSLPFGTELSLGATGCRGTVSGPGFSIRIASFGRWGGGGVGVTVPSGSTSDCECHCMFLCYCFVICLLPLPVVAAIVLSYSNMPAKWTDNGPHDGECQSRAAGLWAAKPRRCVQHKERKPRAKVSNATGPMLNDDDGQDTDWNSLIDGSGFRSQGINSFRFTVLTIVPDQPAEHGFKLCPALPCPGPGPVTSDM